ncbi:hypothetical protein GGTG_11536 [Gaeumannomyces tritici R3-111a-1]|uniref:Uncharacterized protein n=1 Tax=Gaeumannomyces tritici (strain R3-111a-1) TaxID=644352 RepID=J3PDG5_GAET3|nr:hypothetical protein GGTG_11536 [Gaeumannomyces tritici R3-111a-1]EJT70513.1 hypothetical protein GGTG_11536 [Gaeumannomyces tritici R3-111a-1]
MLNVMLYPARGIITFGLQIFYRIKKAAKRYPFLNFKAEPVKFSKSLEICGAFLIFCSGNLTAFSNVLNVALSVIISGAKLQMPFLNLFDPFR